VVSSRVEVTDRAAMRQMVDNLRTRLESGVIVLGSVSDGRVALAAAVSKDLTDRLDADKIVKAAKTWPKPAVRTPPSWMIPLLRWLRSSKRR